MYYQLYSILSDYLYGFGAVLTSEQQLTMTIICTLCVLFIIAVPFLIVWQIIKLFL